jgi:hypothetical protein
MSTTRNAAAQRMTAAAGARAEGTPARRQTAIDTNAARLTLNLPPDLYRELQRWATSAADELDRPRVGVQDTLRATIRALVTDETVAAAVISQLRAEAAESAGR